MGIQKKTSHAALRLKFLLDSLRGKFGGSAETNITFLQRSREVYKLQPSAHGLVNRISIRD